MASRRFSRKKTRSLKSGMRLIWRRRGWRPIITLLGIFFLFGAATVLWWSRDLPSPQDLDSSLVSESTKIYDRTGTVLLYEIGDVHRTIVSLDHISRYIRQATLAAEDDQFYKHHGLDLRGIARALLVNLSGRSLQGGSTITQQLIKNSILTPERTLQRKVKEAVLALELEQRFSKDEIFAMYLNQIPYGSQSYGVEAAAQAFFGKSAANLSLAEAAILAALPKAPTYYSPYGSHYEDLKSRQEHILNRMITLAMISNEEAEIAKNEKVEFVQRRESITAPHFVFYVKELLDEQLGERLVEQGGLTITTTLDATMQEIADKALKENEARINGLGASNGSLVAVDPKSGDIRAMVGSVDYFNEEIDGNVNVSIRHRSPGSSIKPFVYAAAFDRGYTPDTILVDAETDFGQDYTPKNYNLAQHGPVTMRVALANSMNIPAVKTLYLAGVKTATDLAQRMGMDSLNDPDRYGLSLVLGGGEVRLIDEVSAYGVFANEGVRMPHRAVLKVVDANKEVIIDETEKEKPGEQVLEPQIARLVTNILADNGARALTFGTGSYLQLGSRPVAAKTGTTQDFRDGWTVGYTPSLAAGVWVGNNDNSPMGKNAPGANTAAPIWNAFMRQALSGTPIEIFTQPEPLRDLPHAVLRGEMSEVKGKWDQEAGSIYTSDCPIAVGTPKTFKELHNILFYVRRANPRGAPPAHAEADPQFDRWEAAVNRWRDKHNEETKNDPNEPHYGASLPEPICGIQSSDDLPKVHIKEPTETVLRNSPVKVSAEVETDRELAEVRFLLDGKEFARRSPGEGFEASFSFDNNFSGRKTLQVLAITTDKLIGRTHKNFVINPDSSPPKIILHTPQDNSVLGPTNFPVTIKATATDDSGIELVDFLYNKEGASGTSRIGRTDKLAPTAPNRYEVRWEDSPGPGVYSVYAVVYDVTGNSTQTPPRTVVVN